MVLRRSNECFEKAAVHKSKRNYRFVRLAIIGAERSEGRDCAQTGRLFLTLHGLKPKAPYIARPSRGLVIWQPQAPTFGRGRVWLA